MSPYTALAPLGTSVDNNLINQTYKTNLVTSRNANLAEQHDLDLRTICDSVADRSATTA